MHGVLDEEQVYRLDHFLGKEATQNLHVLRFANAGLRRRLVQPGRRQVQIDVPETLDIDDRAEFYDATGATLDMVVTHLFQVAAEIAMEPPASLGPGDLIAARESVIACFRPLDPGRSSSASTTATATSRGSPTAPPPTRSSRRGCGSTPTSGAASLPAAHRQASGRLRAAGHSHP